MFGLRRFLGRRAGASLCRFTFSSVSSSSSGSDSTGPVKPAAAAKKGVAKKAAKKKEPKEKKKKTEAKKTKKKQTKKEKEEEAKAASAAAAEPTVTMDDAHSEHGLKPTEIITDLSRFIIGQDAAKKAVAIAIRNRWRRHRLSPEMQNEVMPKNILMVGPTGVGKTEIARRMSKLVNAPFIKVEATKFTEVGYHGRDVDQIVRDLVMVGVNLAKERKRETMKARVSEQVENKILDSLTGSSDEREHFRGQLRQGLLENVEITVDVPRKEPEGGPKEMPGGIVGGGQQFIVNFHSLMGGKSGNERRKVTVGDARALIENAVMSSLLVEDELHKEALKMVENDGIVFLDEVDKICRSPNDYKGSADASAEGVQRDLLPLIEGTTIDTKIGNVKTDKILFIASGAFQSCKPSDLISELQGRLPIRVELQPLREEHLLQILTETENSPIKQQIALLATEGVELHFTDDAVREIAKVSAEVNQSVENIGARRIHTIIERVIEDVSFDAPEMADGSKFEITKEYVRKKIDSMLLVTDLKKYIL